MGFFDNLKNQIGSQFIEIIEWLDDSNDTLVYRFTLTLQDDNNANGGATPLSSGSHAFTWEARNQ